MPLLRHLCLNISAEDAASADAAKQMQQVAPLKTA